ncbi:hypothetical protein [Actinoplanes derwentensis]|uniref:DegT/DnrJ/EryC1/StrS aminotransferase family protein n=1 Tax=Actinoplanes derwentensis TaxID=113562 RepID=A0A1H2AX14_9ACTN|nr:hypothetical protein [Actinoplanes derwentensis]GID87261.1 hypothetical protein Ade03nite_61850 [Actinoplanes derwentensis]SDT50590.1 hypothetical protein SAMN04489716_4166 [Actinoplanes derwentensis]
MPLDPPREIGSEFHWDPAVLLSDERGGLPGWLPERRSLFATAAGALSALLGSFPGRLHVPSYFCMGVAEFLSHQMPIVFYRHLPGGTGPDFGTLRVRDGDVVLAQNLFGCEDGGPWDDWMRAHPGVPVVEDHSHDPFSSWACASTASYVVASLRKTLPLPDGALLWSPRGLDLPEPSGPPAPGADLKLAAMLLKGAWLDGRPVPKDHFRRLQTAGERQLLGSAGPASAVTAALLPLLDIAGVRSVSALNSAEVAAALGVKAGGFRVQLMCRSSVERDELLRFLAGQGIYAPVHWRQDRDGFWSADPAAADLADRMLTLPVDHRCGPGDLRRIAEAVKSGSKGSSMSSMI